MQSLKFIVPAAEKGIPFISDFLVLNCKFREDRADRSSFLLNIEMVELPFSSISPEILKVEGNTSSNGIDDVLIATSSLSPKATIPPSRIVLSVLMSKNE